MDRGKWKRTGRGGKGGSNGESLEVEAKRGRLAERMDKRGVGAVRAMGRVYSKRKRRKGRRGLATKYDEVRRMGT